MNTKPVSQFEPYTYRSLNLKPVCYFSRNPPPPNLVTPCRLRVTIADVFGGGGGCALSGYNHFPSRLQKQQPRRGNYHEQKSFTAADVAIPRGPRPASRRRRKSPGGRSERRWRFSTCCSLRVLCRRGAHTAVSCSRPRIFCCCGQFCRDFWLHSSASDPRGRLFRHTDVS